MKSFFEFCKEYDDEKSRRVSRRFRPNKRQIFQRTAKHPIKEDHHRTATYETVDQLLDDLDPLVVEIRQIADSIGELSLNEALSSIAQQNVLNARMLYFALDILAQMNLPDDDAEESHLAERTQRNVSKE